MHPEYFVFEILKDGSPFFMTSLSSFPGPDESAAIEFHTDLQTRYPASEGFMIHVLGIFWTGKGYDTQRIY